MKRTALAATSLLLLAACSASPQAAPTAEPSSTPTLENGLPADEDVITHGDEKYVIDLDNLQNSTYSTSGVFVAESEGGSTIAVTFDEPCPNYVTKIAEASNDGPVSCAAIDVDNRDGDHALDMYSLEATDKDGKKTTFSSTQDFAVTAQDGANGKNADTINDLIDEAMTGDIAVGERDKRYLVGPAEHPEVFTTITVNATAMTEVYMPVPVTKKDER